MKTDDTLHLLLVGITLPLFESSVIKKKVSTVFKTVTPQNEGCMLILDSVQHSLINLI
jgi:hypothetical protein